MPSFSPVRHLILIGLPGAGKSTAGRLVAERLRTHCTDIDPIIERATGLSVADFFQHEGEAAFRERERLAVEQALALPPHVIAPGGGWAAEPGNLAAVGDRALTVHLAVDPAVAASRLAGDHSRPLLQGGDSGSRIRMLAEARRPHYERAAATIDVSGLTAAETADRLLELARTRAGWA